MYLPIPPVPSPSRIPKTPNTTTTNTNTDTNTNTTPKTPPPRVSNIPHPSSLIPHPSSLTPPPSPPQPFLPPRNLESRTSKLKSLSLSLSLYKKDTSNQTKQLHLKLIQLTQLTQLIQPLQLIQHGSKPVPDRIGWDRTEVGEMEVKEKDDR